MYIFYKFRIAEVAFPNDRLKRNDAEPLWY